MQIPIWETKTASSCFFPSKLQYLSIEQSSNAAPGSIKANYGDDNGEALSFIFKIPKRPWDCAYFIGPSIPNTIGCAQDM